MNALEFRFWTKVDMSGGPQACWPWLAGIKSTGYGNFTIRHGVGRYAHRLAWEFANKRKIPTGKYCCHTCDNPTCVNPLHLFIGYQKDNVADSIQKGRFKPWPLTHCKNGHLYTKESVYIKPNGMRRCKACHNLRQRNYKKRKYELR